jgi:transcription antitermination factor NusG
MNGTQWYAVRSKSRCEKVAAEHLSARGFEKFLPLYPTRRRWTDRTKVIELPLFSGYVFCRFDSQNVSSVLGAPGVAYVVSFGHGPVGIPDDEIEAIRRVIASGLASSPCLYFKEGVKVTIRNGPLVGLTGQLQKARNNPRLVISVEMLQRSVAVEVDQGDVEAA